MDGKKKRDVDQVGQVANILRVGECVLPVPVGAEVFVIATPLKSGESSLLRRGDSHGYSLATDRHGQRIVVRGRVRSLPETAWTPLISM